MDDLLMLELRLMIECGDWWIQRVNSSRELYCCWLLSSQLMPRIAIFLLCLPQKFKAMQSTSTLPVPTPAYHIFCYSAVVHILTPSVNLDFRPKSGFKNKCPTWAGFGLVISVSDWDQASKWGPFTTLWGYVCRDQQVGIERIHPSPTNSKNRYKVFCEVGYANFRPNVFAAGKRISMEILVRWGCMHNAQ